MTTKVEAVAALKALRQFMGESQRLCVADLMRGEERQFFFDKIAELAATVAGMPKTYEQEGKGDSTVAYLHYFAGGQANWWIIEKDTGEEQIQAFGLADLGYGPELGYISLEEIMAWGAELDFHFKPTTLGELKMKQAA